MKILPAVQAHPPDNWQAYRSERVAVIGICVPQVATEQHEIRRARTFMCPRIQRRLSEPMSPSTGAVVVMRGYGYLVEPASVLIMDGPGRLVLARPNRDRAGSG